MWRRVYTCERRVSKKCFDISGVAVTAAALCKIAHKEKISNNFGRQFSESLANPNPQKEKQTKQYHRGGEIESHYVALGLVLFGSPGEGLVLYVPFSRGGHSSNSLDQFFFLLFVQDDVPLQVEVADEGVLDKRDLEGRKYYIIMNS